MGGTGAGKTSWVASKFPDAITWKPRGKRDPKDDSPPWWPVYSDGEPVAMNENSAVFIDEAVLNEPPYPSWAPCGVPRVWLMYMKDIVGFGPYYVETKSGKMVDFLARTIIVASTVPVEDWYLTAEGEIQSEWLRRLKSFAVLHECVQPGVEPVSVRYNDVVEERLSAFVERRAARAAAAAFRGRADAHAEEELMAAFVRHAVVE